MYIVHNKRVLLFIYFSVNTNFTHYLSKVLDEEDSALNFRVLVNLSVQSSERERIVSGIFCQHG